MLRMREGTTRFESLGRRCWGVAIYRKRVTDVGAGVSVRHSSFNMRQLFVRLGMICTWLAVYQFSPPMFVAIGLLGGVVIWWPLRRRHQSMVLAFHEWIMAGAAVAAAAILIAKTMNVWS